VPPGNLDQGSPALVLITTDPITEICDSRQPRTENTQQRMTFSKVAVFCGSSSGARPEYAAAARELGAELVKRYMGLVYGGGNVGCVTSGWWPMAFAVLFRAVLDGCVPYPG
jgi:hypothetical protein